ncbi:MAG: methyltransferase domain-containing protein [Solirubrobacterales bacterium]
MESADFKQASQTVWSAMAPGWDERHGYIEEVTRPVTERMIERLAPEPGQTILDLAAGTGVVGFAAAPLVGGEGRVIVSDFSEAMVEAARRRAAGLGLDNVDCRVLDAERIDLPDGEVDGVLCRWGYMLMPSPATALAETHRVLRDGGRLSSAVFASAGDNPWAAIPSRVLLERGHMAQPKAGAPGILALADLDRLRGLITGAGFAEPRIDEVSFEFSFEDAADYWEFLLDAAGAIAMVLGRLDDEELNAVRVEVAGVVASFEGDDGLAFPAKVYVASAT